MHSDIRRVLPAMTRAFWTFPETVHLLPNEAKRARVLPRYLASDLRDARAVGVLQIAERDGQAVGAAAWLPPGAYPISLRRQLAEIAALVPALPWGVGAAREAQRGQAANRRAHRQFAEPHFFLRTIGVDPDHQGKGIGNELVAPMLAAADAQHVGAFLFTGTEANAAWYHRLGFETVEQYHPTPTWPLVWAMLAPTALAGELLVGETRHDVVEGRIVEVPCHRQQ